MTPLYLVKRTKLSTQVCAQYYCLIYMFSLECLHLFVFFFFFAEDLDKTLEAPPERVSPKGDPNPEPHKREVQLYFMLFNKNLPFTAAWLFNIKLISPFRNMQGEQHCLMLSRAPSLGQPWLTKAVCPLTTTAAS